MERVVDLLRQQAVRLDHQRHVRRLHRDLDVGEAGVLEVGDLLLGAGDERLRRGPTEGGSDVLVEAPRVHADPDGDAGVGGGPGHVLDVLLLADVPRVQPHRLHAGVDGGEREPVLEMDVGHDGHGRPGQDLGEGGGGVFVVAGDAHDVAARAGQRVHLLEGALDVGRLGRGHGLHRHRCSPADRDAPHHDALGDLARERPLDQLDLHKFNFIGDVMSR